LAFCTTLRYLSDVEKNTPSPGHAIPLQGKLLLAGPTLQDSIFDHSVVLLAEHSKQEGAFGLVLNRPTGHVVGDLLPDDAFSPLHKVAVHHGGPVSQEHLTFSAFWWSSKKNQLRWAIRISAEDAIAHSHRPGTLIRAFIGYSGWTPGQLESELSRDSWITTSPDGALLGRDHDRELWAEILRHLSPYHRILAEAPPDPMMN
jgi:putative transcriptional regulator